MTPTVTPDETDEPGAGAESIRNSRREPRHMARDRGVRGVRAEIAGARTIQLVTAMVIVILAGGLVFATFRIHSQSSQSSLRSSALSAAAKYGVYLSSYDYQNLSGPTAPWTLVETHSTAKFEKDFRSTSGDLSKLLTQYKATAQGQVVAAGLSSVTSSRAVVLLFVDQTVTNTVQKPNTVTQPLRVRLTMLRQGGKWLIDALDVPK